MTIANLDASVDGAAASDSLAHADPLVPILIDRYVTAWPPAEQDSKECEHLPLSEVLTATCASDAHFSAYSRPDAHPRLKVEALVHVGSVPMVALIFDVDCEASHKATGGSSEKPATEEWFEVEREKISRLLQRHPGAFVYRTRGGYRIVYLLPAPFLVTSETQGAWSIFYIRACLYLARDFGIVADPACSDWTHIYRVPHATRDEGGQPEALETLGDPARIGVWTYVPPEGGIEADINTASALGSKNPTWKKRGLTPLLRAIRKEAPQPTQPSASSSTATPAFQAGATIDSPDWPSREERVKRAKRYVSKIPGAISGQAGHSATFAVAVILVRGFALPLDTALEILSSEFNPQCQPPWSPRELQHKISCAANANAPLGYLLTKKTARAEVILSTREHEAVDQAVAALGADATLFHRGGKLVRVIREPDHKSTKKADAKAHMQRAPSAPHIAPVPLAHLRERLTFNADIKQRNDREELVAAHPPEWLVRAVEARGTWSGVRKLLAVIETPVLRHDGTIVSDPGYDPDTGLLFLPLASYLPVPDNPTSTDVAQAAVDLLDVISDFPFATEAHRAAAVAGMLNPFFRFAYAGPTPAVVIDATTPGTGKGLLADVVARIALGRSMARMPQARNEEEESKRILAVALSGDLQILIDNVSKPLGSGPLDAALTATEWNDRILGKSETVRVPLLTQWYFTGNNVQYQGDTGRRILVVRMESLEERPEERSAFKYPNLIEYVMKERAKLVHAALTIGRAFFVAGAPAAGLKPWGSFEGWSATVRAAVVFAGLADPAATRDTTISRADLESGHVAALVRELEGAVMWNQKQNNDTRGITSSEIVKYLERNPKGELCTVVSELARVRAGLLPTVGNVAYLLRKYVGRVVGGKRIMSEKVRDRVAWHVEVVDASQTSPHAPVDCGDRGDRGDEDHFSTDEDREYEDEDVDVVAMGGDGEHHHDRHHHHMGVVLPLRPIRGRGR